MILSVSRQVSGVATLMRSLKVRLFRLPRSSLLNSQLFADVEVGGPQTGNNVPNKVFDKMINCHVRATTVMSLHGEPKYAVRW